MKYLLVLFGLMLGFVVAQNRLYVRVEYNPSMQLLGFGGSGFFYDHILLLSDGTAFRFDDISKDSDQVLPSGINLVTASASDLIGGTRGTFQDDGNTVTTSFGISFPSSGGKYDPDFDLSGYMFIPSLQPSFITGEYNNFSATVIGGGFTNTPQVSAGQSNNYFFYGDGKFGFEESSGVSSTTESVGVTSSSEGSAAGSYLFEGYNLYLTYNDGSKAILPAYLWPPYQPFIDQILMVGEDEFLNEEESSLPIQLLPANIASSVQNPLSSQGQNPLENQTQNPLTNQAQNPLTDASNPLTQPVTPVTEMMVSGVVTLPDGFSVDRAVLTVCPMDMKSSDCVIGRIEPSGSYSVPLSNTGDYLVMAAIDTDGNTELNTGDYLGYQTFTVATGEVKNIDLLATPYTQ